jgi:hypothetical protein
MTPPDCVYEFIYLNHYTVKSRYDFNNQYHDGYPDNGIRDMSKWDAIESTTTENCSFLN